MQDADTLGKKLATKINMMRILQKPHIPFHYEILNNFIINVRISIGISLMRSIDAGGVEYLNFESTSLSADFQLSLFTFDFIILPSSVVSLTSPTIKPWNNPFCAKYETF